MIGEREMDRDVKLKKYNKKMDYTYTLGAFPTIELLKSCPEHVVRVLVHEDMNSEKQRDIITGLCRQHAIPLETASRQVEKLRDKENCFVVGIFEKYTCFLDKKESHVVLVNPSDSGNMGTIIRTCAGFGICNLVIIEPAADVFHPKVIRASMGALFRINVVFYNSFEAYYLENSADRKIYPFMLKGAVSLQSLQRKRGEIYSLVFGNEATGLEDKFLEYGQSVLIAHTSVIDSLNLSIALGIGLYEFTK